MNQLDMHGKFETIRRMLNPEVMQDLETPLQQLPMRKNLDKIRGCLIGGASGDALGYPIEFSSEKDIFSEYGEEGITDYVLRGGKALVSDDTQMTLFTANGILYATTRWFLNGLLGPYPDYISLAYRNWYQTQTEKFPLKDSPKKCCWLLNDPRMFASRAPGNTCLSAIASGKKGSPEKPINDSKGCGGVMRAAPLGLYFEPSPTLDLMGADTAALTHGHPLGYLPAAMLVHIISLVSHNSSITLQEAVADGRLAMERLFAGTKYLPDFLSLIDRAVALSEMDMGDLHAIHQLGEGWTGEETLAIAIYCSLKYAGDFEKAIITAVNHGGDSDSTGAVTGNILGAYLGLSGIPAKFIYRLELEDIILELAADLFHDCCIDGYTPPETRAEKTWYDKYAAVNFRISQP